MTDLEKDSLRNYVRETQEFLAQEFAPEDVKA